MSHVPDESLPDEQQRAVDQLGPTVFGGMIGQFLASYVLCAGAGSGVGPVWFWASVAAVVMSAAVAAAVWSVVLIVRYWSVLNWPAIAVSLMPWAMISVIAWFLLLKVSR